MQTKNNKIYKISKIIYSCTIIMSFLFLTSSFVNIIPGRTRYAINIVFILYTICIFLLRNEHKIKKQNVFFALSSLLPYVVILIVVLIKSFFSDVITINMIINKMVIIIYWCIPIISMLCAGYLFKEDAIDITFYATIISYLFSIFQFFMIYKIQGIIHFFTYATMLGSPLEQHELVFSLGLFFIYYFLFEDKKVKNHKFKVFICAMFLFMGFKRIELVSIIIVSILYKFVLQGNNFKIKVNIISIIILCICIIYISFIKSGGLDTFAQKYNIDFMSRLTAYDYFNKDYCLNLFYQGKGLGYVSYTLENVGSLLFGIGDLHNDILKYYIEMGCIGWILFFMNFILLQTKRILKKINIQIARLYFTLTLFTMIIIVTDNVLRYLQYMLVFFLIPYICSFKLRGGKE